MLVVNGTDYTLWIFIVATVVVLFGVQFLLCRKTRKLGIKLLPMLIVVACFVMVPVTMLSSNHGSFLDLRGLVSMLFALYGLICAAAIGAAWLANWLINRRKQ